MDWGRACARLREGDRGALASLLEARGREPLGAYARSLYEGAALGARPWEGALREGLREALGDVLGGPEEVSAALGSLERGRVLQTGCHATASQGPVLFGASALTALGAPEGAPVLIGAWSGLPLSNGAWPGCLNFSDRWALEEWVAPGVVLEAQRRRAASRARDSAERRVVLVGGGASRDAPLWRVTIDAPMLEALGALRGPLRAALPEAVEGAPYVGWALRLCGRVESSILSKQLIFFDLCRAVTAYLRVALRDESHPLSEALWGRWRLDWGALPPRPLWLRAGARRVEGLRSAARVEALAGLEEGWLRPGVWLAYLSLGAMGAVRCLGGVDQWESWPRLAAWWAASPWGASLPLAPGGLTSGRCVDREGRPIYPLDVWMGARWRLRAEETLGGFVAPQLVRLLGRPFQGGRPR